ncbi:MAG: ribose-5-phosphate isomerase RpiA [Deltaproteobacteria bacterium]|nr:ribose-5-phosphate isomerase RpiA [Deltaproteobacteria bacterium]
MANDARTRGGSDDPAVQAVAEKALELIADGAKVGLGSGRASAAFIARLGERVRRGLRVVGVPTSDASEAQARALGIPLVEIDDTLELDLTVDGADEVAPNLDLVKGWGGALVRERIVAAASRRQVILVGPEKLVPGLGARGRVPVEVIPLARGYVARRLRAFGIIPTVRTGADGVSPFVTDNGNLTLDCRLPHALQGAQEARALEAQVLEIAGVVDTGLFLGTAERVLIGRDDGRVEVLIRASRGTPGGAP